jgi:dTDP-glucose pyrophosphorylase
MRPPARTFQPDQVVDAAATLQEAVARIDRNRCGGVCVVDGAGLLLGMLTDGDIRRQVLRGTDLRVTPVGEAMQRRPVTATPDFSRSQLRHLMRARSISQIPVVDDGNRLLWLALASELLEAPATGRPVLVMAGGQGVRLRPLTLARPKPLLPVAGRPILEHVIERLVECGFPQVLVATGYQSQMIEDHLQDGRQYGASIRYLREEQPLGTAGVLATLADEIQGDLLVMNGDILTTVDFAALLESHLASGADMTVAVREMVEQLEYGVVKVEGEWVTSIEEKPRRSLLLNAGIYVVGPRMRQLAADQGRFDMTDLIRWGIGERRRVRSYPLREFWLDIGRMADYERANRLAGRLGTEGSGAWLGRLSRQTLETVEECLA